MHALNEFCTQDLAPYLGMPPGINIENQKTKKVKNFSKYCWWIFTTSGHLLACQLHVISIKEHTNIQKKLIS